jgi:hypothetical protein
MPTFPQRPLAVTHHCAHCLPSGAPVSPTGNPYAELAPLPAAFMYSLAMHDSTGPYCATVSATGWVMA